MPSTPGPHKALLLGASLVPDLASLTLKGDTVRVIRVPKEELGATDDAADADFHLYNSTIRVRDDADPQAYLRLLGHEIAHYQLDWSGIGELLPKDAVEGICDWFGASIVEIVRDNKALCEAIWEVYGK